MSYRYGHPFWSRSGGAWFYWGRHVGKVPEIVGPFASAQEAQDHADKNLHKKTKT